MVSVVDPAGAVARRVEQVLAVAEIEQDQADTVGHCPAAPSLFFTSGRPEMLANAIRDLALHQCDFDMPKQSPMGLEPVHRNHLDGVLAGLEPRVEGITWDSTETRVVRHTGAYSYGTIP
jgi:hypothetical protein